MPRAMRALTCCSVSTAPSDPRGRKSALEILRLAVGLDLNAHVERQHERRAEGVAELRGAAEQRIHRVLEAVVGRVESAHGEQRRVRVGELSPAVQFVGAVQRLIESAQDVVDEQLNRAAVAEVHAICVGGDREIEGWNRPRACAAIPSGDRAELTLETGARVRWRGGEELRHRARYRRVGRGRGIEDEGAVVRVSVAVDVADHSRGEGRSGLRARGEANAAPLWLDMRDVERHHMTRDRAARPGDDGRIAGSGSAEAANCSRASLKLYETVATAPSLKCCRTKQAMTIDRTFKLVLRVRSVFRSLNPATVMFTLSTEGLAVKRCAERRETRFSTFLSV